MTWCLSTAQLTAAHQNQILSSKGRLNLHYCPPPSFKRLHFQFHVPFYLLYFLLYSMWFFFILYFCKALWMNICVWSCTIEINLKLKTAVWHLASIVTVHQGTPEHWAFRWAGQCSWGTGSGTFWFLHILLTWSPEPQSSFGMWAWGKKLDRGSKLKWKLLDSS